MSVPIPIVFDTDCGIDDAVALWYALEHPDIDVVAITAVGGNTEVTQAARNVAKVLDAAGRTDIPVAVGVADRYAPGVEVPRSKTPIHGHDGLGDAGHPDAASVTFADMPAHELLVQLTRERPGELTLVAVGPLSNIARALDADEGVARRVDDLVIMGGVAMPPGNITAQGEFNVAFDPAAADVVVRGAWPRPPLMVGLDVTNVATLGHSELGLIGQRRTAAAAFLDGPLSYYREVASVMNPSGAVPCHDLVAVVALTEPDLLVAPELPIAVDTGGSASWGTTVVDLRPRILASGRNAPPELVDRLHRLFYRGKSVWRIALEVDVARFRRVVCDVLFEGNG